MISVRLPTAFFAVLAAGGLSTASAQGPGALGPPPLTPSARPVTSPYLDLSIDNERFGGATYQYYRQVRPEMEFRRNNAQLGNELRRVERRLNEPMPMAQSPTSDLGTTGHATTFQNYRNFFPGMRRR